MATVGLARCQPLITSNTLAYCGQNVNYDQGDQMIWKKLPNFLKSGQNDPNNAKIQIIFLNSLFQSK